LNGLLLGVAAYGILPTQAGGFFEKIECFCFDEQLLGPKETVVMPVLFVLDPAILKAKNMKSEWDITLNYTFFPSIDQNTYNFDFGQSKPTPETSNTEQLSLKESRATEVE
jgi:cytochrome c oxidase assembly protein subunit 11